MRPENLYRLPKMDSWIESRAPSAEEPNISLAALLLRMRALMASLIASFTSKGLPGSTLDLTEASIYSVRRLRTRSTSSALIL